MAAEIIGEREMDYDSDDDMGVAVFRCDRDSPDSDKLKGQYYKSMADLAIDFYNQQTAKEYRLVELILLDGIFSLLSELYMRFTAKLDDDSDAATFEASIFTRATETGEITKIEYVRIVDKAAV